ncbi:MAG: hypothetical protein P4L87_03135 [Formivibrio sp.]|nr:hypothetical protein [Formivibrio sp.]
MDVLFDELVVNEGEIDQGWQTKVRNHLSYYPDASRDERNDSPAEEWYEFEQALQHNDLHEIKEEEEYEEPRKDNMSVTTESVIHHEPQSQIHALPRRTDSISSTTSSVMARVAQARR